MRDGAIGVGALTGAMALGPVDALAKTEAGVEWRRAPCRFCGTGCSVLMRVKDGRLVAATGDPKSPVNQGTLCVKGYSLPLILYGKDRLTVPLMRTRGGSYDEHGDFSEVSWDAALDVIADKAKASLAQQGPAGVAMFGSGQWTVWEGYAASKLWKGGLKSNSLEVNARHCMASAVAGFMTSFGMDEPMGAYDDFEHADAFVLWGANVAEMHPILYSKIADRLGQSKAATLINLTTISNRSSALASREILFQPQSDLALANGIANLLIKNGKVDRGFVERHTVFKRGKTDIGYGTEDKFGFKEQAAVTDFDEYRKLVAEYTPEKVEELSGVSREDLERLAGIYGDPKVKVMSLWTMGVNQHTRGTWMNNLIYNLHLLTGKICEPGNAPFSLTGQPSACGTCREVGTFTHRLPSDRVVMNAEHRAEAERIWKLPQGTIPAKPTYHAVEMMRALDRGDVTFFWSMTTNPFHTYANLSRFRPGARKDGRFVVVSDVYPNRSTEVADVILPAAMWVEKEGAFGNAERRTQLWHRMVDPPGQARSDLWQIIEFGKRMGLGSLFEFPAAKYPTPKGIQLSDATETAGMHIERALWEEYRLFSLDNGHDLGPYEAYHKGPGNQGLRWPVVDGRETVRRYREGSDPYVPAGKGVYFYGNKKHDGKAAIWLRPYEPPAEIPDAEYPLWLCTGRVLEHWHSGTMTQRVKALYKAYPHASAHLHPDDAAALKITGGDRVRIESRRGSIEIHAEIGGRVTPQQGMVYVPFFDEDLMINDITLDAFCPISKQTDYKKCAVKLTKV
jgi:nitrate reductase NapA